MTSHPLEGSEVILKGPLPFPPSFQGYRQVHFESTSRLIKVKSRESVLFRFRTAKVFDLAAAMFTLQPSFLGRQRGLCPFADFGPLGCLADQTQQSGNRVLAVLFLGAKPPGIDNKKTFLGHTLSG